MSTNRARRRHGGVAECRGLQWQGFAGVIGAVSASPVRGTARHPGGAIFRADDRGVTACRLQGAGSRSEEHTSELQSLMRISYAVFCLKTKKTTPNKNSKPV